MGVSRTRRFRLLALHLRPNPKFAALESGERFCSPASRLARDPHLCNRKATMYIKQLFVILPASMLVFSSGAAIAGETKDDRGTMALRDR
jgi:hypothetical protein